MQNLFNLTPPGSVGILKYPEWDNIRTGLRRNLATVMRYYQQTPMAVDSSHFLVRLLHAIAVPQSLPLDRYYEVVDGLSLNLSMALKMTSSIFKGQVFEGIFYGKGCSEVLIAYQEDFNFEHAHKNWEHLQAVKVLRQPRTDLGFNLPNGTDNPDQTGMETGLVVISVNITMLAIQYRAFRMNEQRLSEFNGGDSQRSMYQFIHMYVLTNMLPSQTDNVILNRIYRLALGAPLGAPARKHSFYLTDWALKLNKVQEKMLDGLERVGKDFSSTLVSIPAVAHESLWESTRLPDTAPTRQVLWALVIAQLPTLVFLMHTVKGSARTRNGMDVNRVIKAVRALHSESLMQSVLPPRQLRQVMGELYYVTHPDRKEVIMESFKVTT